MAILDSVEFYVMAAVAAAAVVGLCVRPSDKGEARQFLLAGDLRDDDGSAGPSVSVEVTEEGKVILTRHGLSGLVHGSGALSLVVTVAGFDISIEERLTPGHQVEGEPSPGAAVFCLDFLAPERYHLRYFAEAIGGLAVMPLHVRPGITTSRPLI